MHRKFEYYYWITITVMLTVVYTWPTATKTPIDGVNVGRTLFPTALRSGFNFLQFLSQDNHTIVVGTKNAMLNVSLSTLSVIKTLEWPPTADDVSLCLVKGKTQNDCHNFIRLMYKQPDNRMIICGTNAFKPLCRQYQLTAKNDYEIVREFSGVAIVPFDPRQNGTALYVPETDEIYTATFADFSGSSPLIYRKPLSGPTAELRTKRYDTKFLNDPHFISSLDDGDSIYFWFREAAAEYNNCGTAVFSRIARVCKSDQGDYKADAETWTTYIKARLNCSLSGQVPFYFNEIAATSNLVVTERNGKKTELIYAIFNTPSSALRASAICAFSMEEVRYIFNNGPFKVQKTPSSLWLPIYQANLPTPRPGDCQANSKTIGERAANFVRMHSLLSDAVPNYFEQPLVVDTSLGYQFTALAVDVVQSVSGFQYSVLFVGTNDGRVLKYVNVAQDTKVNSVLIEIIHFFADRAAISNIRVVHSSDEANQKTVSLLISTNDQLKLVPAHYCANKTSCRTCTQLQDPYCAWDLIRSQCVSTVSGNWSESDFAQSVSSGQSPLCMDKFLEEDGFYPNDFTSAYPLVESRPIYTAECMVIAVVVTLVVASAVAFLIGYRCARWKIPFEAVPSYDSPLRKTLNSRTDHSEAYMSHLTVGKLNEASMTMTYSDRRNEKDLLTVKNGTLPRDYKTKKVYL
ncbi:Semaphorin-1A [Trichinella pseudospiralis]|uniref:Semaphorin-1A n=1 Tax=Trichinella pseudospiralis TaxID=6337 RepID=A0A0V1EKR6_TRIPS|nr:Semaphorin-1A [Trichinella pseudospiralis]KRY74415.1 Semaphorin-1A [Trichinella pseudospiralis]KRY84740.1 Semaphorin-1A [Trichinella pseudospiralis]